MLENDTNTDPAVVNNPNHVEFVLGLAGDGSASAAAPFVSDLSADASAEAEASTGFVRTGGFWIPDTAAVDMTIALTGAAEFDAEGKDLLGSAESGSSTLWSHLASVMRHLSGGITSTVGGSLDVSGSVDLIAHPEVLADLVELIGAARTIRAASATATQRLNYERRAASFAAAVARDGDLEMKLYSVEKGSLNIDVTYGDILSFGGAANVDVSEELLAGAWFRAPGSQLEPSTTCRSVLTSSRS